MTTWTDDIDKNILDKWKAECVEFATKHTIRETRYRRLSTIITAIATGISSAATIVGMVTFDDCKQDPLDYCQKYFAILNTTAAVVTTTDNCDYEKWIRLTGTIIGGFGAALMGIYSVFDFQKKAESDKEAADEFSSLSRMIDEIKNTPHDERGDATVVLPHIRSIYDKIKQHAPSLPDVTEVPETPEKKSRSSSGDPTSEASSLAIDISPDDITVVSDIPGSLVQKLRNEMKSSTSIPKSDHSVSFTEPVIPEDEKPVRYNKHSGRRPTSDVYTSSGLGMELARLSKNTSAYNLKE